MTAARTAGSTAVCKVLPVSLGLCRKKRLSGKSRDYGDAIVFEKLRFLNVFHAHENETPAFSHSFSLKSVLKNLRSPGGSVWIDSLTGK